MAAVQKQHRVIVDKHNDALEAMRREHAGAVDEHNGALAALAHVRDAHENAMEAVISLFRRLGS